ncbi:TPA: site-specific DNA-methyltransferase, partial [Legionella pneumophila]|nr:site-specific DNA-methyltransferase [Legionella pneumophila]HBD7430222.1 site-specific DNA-methyltransferase [Legionella pneumophila]HBD7473448.1 site-specific DNA-methyltransferase [Legionella pneumophila]
CWGRAKRRYKGDTYSIPYAGEEIFLHWANRDQYYIKSGENFSNYAFKLDDGRRVSFRLISADTAKDNCKDNGKERCFALIEPQNRSVIDDNEVEYEEILLPVEEVDGELILRLEYKIIPKGSKQEDLVLLAVDTILNTPCVIARWKELGKKIPTEKNPHRTLLEKNLTNYTTKNATDYFIHKDLKRFLNNELDFYIKSEMMHLDEVAYAENFLDIEKNFHLIKTFRIIALDLIVFLAQLEDFQKKLWLKKKFVISAHYCMTLSRVPEILFPIIADNFQQWEQWDSLGVLNDKAVNLFNQTKINRLKFMKDHPYLMVETTLFNNEFKSILLAENENLDENIDGLLIQGDNFAALDTILNSHKGKICNVYIDPPYNTGDDGFLYKDNYPSSTWLSMIVDRLDKGMNLIADDGVMFISIGDEEQEHLATLLRQKYGKERFFSTLVWEKKKKGSFLHGSIARMKDYILCVSKQAEHFSGLIGEIITETETYPCINASNPREIRIISPGIISKYKEENYFLEAGQVISAGNMNIILKSDLVIKNGVLASELIIEGNWRYSQENMSQFAEKKELYITQDLYLRRIVNEPRQKKMKDLLTRNGTDGESDFRSYDVNNLNKYGWGTNEDANDELHQILGEQYASSYPKPSKLLTLLLAASRHIDGFWLDYFAGSGTTAHAVINLNRIDNGNRKYILIEQGNYFNTVLKPRIQKIVYSADWKNGKATAPKTGISHTFKILKIESYEDTLNNLQLVRNEDQQNFLDKIPVTAKDDYLLRYLLDVESRYSLLSVKHFNKPFDCKLKVAVDSAGAYEEFNIDLVETFNYLIGLRIDTIDMQQNKGFVKVTGWSPAGEYVLILWRDTEQMDYQALNDQREALFINAANNKFDIVYFNGDHNISSVFTTDKDEVNLQLKIRQIEPEFLSRMFSVEVM